jgi:predicted anti-sigma-YlaC factor YlaD
MEPRCNSRNGELAMDALGCLDEAERAELAAHLDTCEECGATSAELAQTVSALEALSRTATLAPAADVPPDLTRAVFAGIGAAGQTNDRGRTIRRIALACGSVAAVVVAALSVGTGMGHAKPPTRTIALQGPPGVTATAVLVQKPWGTELTIHEQGLTAGQTYTVSMDNSQGRWWTAGSYRTTSSEPVEATMACAARFASINQIRVTDSAGRAVLGNGPMTTY